SFDIKYPSQKEHQRPRPWDRKMLIFLSPPTVHAHTVPLQSKKRKKSNNAAKHQHLQKHVPRNHHTPRSFIK
ncbi:hypothetical protein, partial [Bartonella sp. CL50QHWL]|uniref:hypothetical protein n=1 Tax=Bartonella sp. CL50QHWL TaxID=3243536 RepID=UPI0035D0AD66